VHAVDLEQRRGIILFPGTCSAAVRLLHAGPAGRGEGAAGPQSDPTETETKAPGYVLRPAPRPAWR